MDILLEHLQSLIRDLSRVLDDGSPSQESIEALVVKAERVQYLITTLVDISVGMDANLHLIETVISSLDALVTHYSDISQNCAFSAPRFISGERGRPRVVISQEMLEYLIGNYFTVSQIAQLLQTSTSTVHRRMGEVGITIRSMYSIIDDHQLDTLVRKLQHQYPNCGYLQGYIAALGHRVRESRIRNALRRIDPSGVVSRWI